MTPREAVGAFYERLWNRRERAALPEILAADVCFRGSLGAERRGHDGFWSYVTEVTTALGSYRCDVQDLVAEGERAFARVAFSGIHAGPLLGFAPTGLHVAWVGAALFTLRDGRIADVWVLGDLHGLAERLRAAAREPSMDR